MRAPLERSYSFSGFSRVVSGSNQENSFLSRKVLKSDLDENVEKTRRESVSGEFLSPMRSLRGKRQPIIIDSPGKRKSTESLVQKLCKKFKN